MLSAVGRRALAWADSSPPWTNVYGVARTLLALSSALTLLFNESTTLFRPVAGMLKHAPSCSTVAQKAALYCWSPKHLDVTRLVAVGLFLLVASGWRPRFTGILHWWLALSYQLTGSTMEGGDQAAAVLTLLLVPVTLTDSRRWHWAPAPAPTRTLRLGASGRAFASLIALSAMLAIRVQVSGIYFHAAVAKLLVPEWQDGTAMYYWLNSPVFGAPALLRALLVPLMRQPAFLATITWGPILIELFLFMGIIASRPARRVLLVLGIGLHLGILFLMGLVTFSIVMFGALVLYLRPVDEPFHLPVARIRGLLDGSFRRPSRPSATESSGVLAPD